MVSAPKLETLGAISDPFEWFEMVFASTPIEALYIIYVHFCNLHFSFVRISLSIILEYTFSANIMLYAQ